jgi:outer membrane receptor protein involved in Fe transport
MTIRAAAILGILALGTSACAAERITRPAAPPVAEARTTPGPATDVVYLLDGKEVTAQQVSAIDPNSIATVEVIKGESARRLLGDRAAYGVVMITSKSGTRTR